MGKNTLSALLVSASFTVAAASASAQNISLRPSLEEEVIDTKIGGSGVFSMGLYADTNVLLNRPFKAVSNPNNKFSYHIPIGVGLDFSLGLSPRWELGASVGYQKYEGRELNGDHTNYAIAGYTSVPVKLLIRRRWPEQVVAPELEIALGAAFQKTNFNSTYADETPLRESRVSPYAHLGGGISYAWGEDLTIHFNAGYAMMMNGTASYTGRSNQQFQANNLVHGIFTKGMVRVQF
ncbi:MAG TPA: hypothetical protein VM901_06095 [Bdellovibrionota bacterium]|nr:hypothetical protein [Bdellovibrionota bacterium]